MEPMGILKLSIAVPGHALNPFFDDGSSSGRNNENARELPVHLDLSQELKQVAIVEVQEEEERGSIRHNSSKHTRLSREHAKQLDEFYRLNHTIDSKQKELADRLNLQKKQVDAWFRNRRSRSKQKSSEMECEYLKEGFGVLKEENCRLQLQVEELRALQLQLQPGTADLLSRLGSREEHSDLLMPRA